MQTNVTEVSRDPAVSEDLKDTLIAISVVSRRLATKLKNENLSKEETQVNKTTDLNLVADAVITQGQKFIKSAKDMIDVCEILIAAVTALKAVFTTEESAQ